jgi:hypothetical protein
VICPWSWKDDTIMFTTAEVNQTVTHILILFLFDIKQAFNLAHSFTKLLKSRVIILFSILIIVDEKNIDSLRLKMFKM